MEAEPRYLLVANEVRAWLARRRLTANAAAKKLGWKQAYISRRLTGAVPFDVADLLSLGDLLEVSPEEFFHAPAGLKQHSGARSIIFWPRLRAGRIAAA